MDNSDWIQTNQIKARNARELAIAKFLNAEMGVFVTEGNARGRFKMIIHDLIEVPFSHHVGYFFHNRNVYINKANGL